MEHGRASIEIWFLMTQWELDRTSARYVIIRCISVCDLFSFKVEEKSSISPLVAGLRKDVQALVTEVSIQ